MLPDKQFLCPASACGCRKLFGLLHLRDAGQVLWAQGLPVGSCAGGVLMGQPSPRRRQNKVVNWDIWESWGSSMLRTNASKTNCCYPKEQVSLSFWADLDSFSKVAVSYLNKGRRRGDVRGDLEVLVWFSNSGKGCEWPGWGGRGHGRNIQVLKGY